MFVLDMFQQTLARFLCASAQIAYIDMGLSSNVIHQFHLIVETESGPSGAEVEKMLGFHVLEEFIPLLLAMVTKEADEFEFVLFRPIFKLIGSILRFEVALSIQFVLSKEVAHDVKSVIFNILRVQLLMLFLSHVLFEDFPSFERLLTIQTVQIIQLLLEYFEEFIDIDKIVSPAHIEVMVKVHVLEQVVRLALERFSTEQAAPDLRIVGAFLPFLLEERF